jgi:predicted ATPase
MLIKRLKVKNLLSFGPEGIDLPLGNLNVLIGPNGSGKSNLLELLALLKAATSNLPEPVKEMGGVREWLWKGKDSLREATVEAIVENPNGKQPLRHGLCISDHGGRFEVVDEYIENEEPFGDEVGPYFFYRFQRGHPVLNELNRSKRELKREIVKPEQSILPQISDPERYPELAWLKMRYEKIFLFRNWSFGPGALLRREQSTQGRADSLNDNCENLALVLQRVRAKVKPEFIESLGNLYEGIEDTHLSIEGGKVLLFLEEKGVGQIPTTRLSDGTLRYLSLLAILLDSEPPPLIAIEEPELGLHPDIIPHLVDLLVRAAQRTQVVVTTHSRLLVDALSDDPSSVIVCNKEDGSSRITRLDKSALAEWIEKYSLGKLWSMGELGGNRW